jgi:hypothetical protein
MKIKTSIAAGLGIILITIISILVIPRSEAQDYSNFKKTEIPVDIKPLIVGNDIVPVHIQCQTVYITRPDTLETFTCKLINATEKNISASVVRYSIIFDVNGKESAVTHTPTAIPYIHPDLANEKKVIQPGGYISVTPLSPAVEPNAVVKRLELQPVYIEFDDETSVGNGGDSAKNIAKVRKGAALYKKMLRKKYIDRGKSTQQIIPLLEDSAPLGLETTDFMEKVGAKNYRKQLRKKYKKDGMQSIDTILDH